MSGTKRKRSISKDLDFANETENTAIITTRDELGLTATIEIPDKESSKNYNIPHPYSGTCLEGKEPNESLIKLAKHTFHKLSQKKKTKWKPTPIQLQSWPILKSKHLNLTAIATTGSGKTLSYVLPMVDSCMNLGKEGGRSAARIHGLVLLPTRELAIQVSKILKIASKSGNKLSGRNDIVALAIYGGVDKQEQIDSLLQRRKDGIASCFVLAATPMRLIDLLGIGDEVSDNANKEISTLFETTKYLVVDEADRMATQSDISKQVQVILDFIRKTSKCLDKHCLFSATLPQRAISTCKEWIPMPRVTVKVDTVTVGSKDGESATTLPVPQDFDDESKGKNDDNVNQGKSSVKDKSEKAAAARRGPLDLSTIPSHITQTLHVCSNHKKPKKLCTTIKKIRDGEKNAGDNNSSSRRRKGLIIIFFGRIKTLQYVHTLLQKECVQCIPFHSQMNQYTREANLNSFRSGKTPILLATDIAARGLHCNNVEYIINYDFPGSLEQYVHRCGRAGRNKVNGVTGTVEEEKKLNATVYSFFHRELAPMAKDVIDLLRSCNAWVDPNLISLVPGGTVEGCESKRKRRKKRSKNEGEGNDSSQCNVEDRKDDEMKRTVNAMDNDSDNEFAALGRKSIVLKRASHVSDNSSEEDDDDD